MGELSFSNGVFIYECDTVDNPLPARAGFSWDRINLVWKTPFIQAAKKVCRASDTKSIALVKEKTDAYNRSWLHSFRKDSIADLPAPPGCEFMPFQKAGIEFIVSRKATLLADDMGLGKTIQAIGACNVWNPSSVLIICKSLLKDNWIREWRKWSTLSLEIGKVSGKKQANFFPVTIINYDIVSFHRENLLSRQWDVIILDEAHCLKNPGAERSKAIFGYGHKKGLRAEKRIAITGSPIENRPIDMFPTLKWLLPEGFYDKFKFATRYCGVVPQAGQRIDWKGSSNESDLQQRLRSTIMIRREKKHVLTDLPEKRRQIIELDEEGDPTTEAAEKALGVSSLNENEFRSAVSKLKYEDIIPFDELARVRYETAVKKIPYGVSYIKSLLDEVEKVVVFAHHHCLIEAIADELGENCVTLTGKTAEGKKQEAVDAFQNDPTVRVFVGNIEAAGIGTTLTAASMMVFLEVDWRPSKMSQAEDRIYRIGQTKNVLIQMLVFKGSLEAHIARTYISKQETIDLIMNHPRGPEMAEILS